MKFNELNEEQKAKALTQYRYVETEGTDWYAELKSDFESELTELGFVDVDSAFTGFCSQGDGASFTASAVNIEKFLKGIGKYEQYSKLHSSIDTGEISVSVLRSTNRYVHPYSVTVFVTEDREHDSTCIENLKEEFSEFVISKSHEYFRKLEKQNDYLESDESVIAYFEANDTEFEVKTPGVTYL